MRSFALVSRKFVKPLPLLRRFNSNNLLRSERTKENSENVNISNFPKKADAFDNFLKGIYIKEPDPGLIDNGKITVGVVPQIKPRNSIYPNKIRNFKTDGDCDQKIVRDLKEFGFDKALKTLKYYDGANRYPSQATCLSLLQISLKNLNLEGIDEVRKVINKAYPQEYQWQMGYEHYVAEYHWKMRNYDKAIEMFDNLFANFSQRRKKLSDMLQFMARKIINDESEYLVKKLMEFVVSLISKYSTHHPAINVWFLLFISDKGVYNNLSRTLLEIKPEKTGPFVINKIDSILKIAKEKNNIDYIQRLVECVLFLTIEKEYTKVFSSLLEHQCKSALNFSLKGFVSLKKLSLALLSLKFKL